MRRLNLCRSDLLESRRIEAHEKLWERVVRFQDELPEPFSEVLFKILISTPQELEKLRKSDELQFDVEDEIFYKMGDSLKDLRLSRPYFEDRLWDMIHGRIAFPMRLLVLFSKDDPNPVPMTNWPEDCLVKQHLLKAFSEEELERVNYSEPGVYEDLVDKWDLRILAEIRKGISGP